MGPEREIQQGNILLLLAKVLIYICIVYIALCKCIVSGSWLAASHATRPSNTPP